MVKFKLNMKGNRIVLGIGLSEENLKRLKENKPILFKLSDFDLDEDVLDNIDNYEITILYGESEKDIADYLKDAADNYDVPIKMPLPH